MDNTLWTLLVMAVAAFSLSIGSCVGSNTERMDAVGAGVGRYEVNADNGNTKFVYSCGGKEDASNP